MRNKYAAVAVTVNHSTEHVYTDTQQNAVD